MADELAVLDRARGCLAGQIAGDALGSLVEFESPAEIRACYPDGVRLMSGGGTWDTIAGQPTDDSELALALARSLVATGRYDEEAAAQAYVAWYESDPFDMGRTIEAALAPAARAVRAGKPAAPAAKNAANRTSQANGALMRVSPLGIFGVGLEPATLAAYARADAALTHPHAACGDANAVYTAAVAYAIRTGAGATGVFEYALEFVAEACPDSAVSLVLDTAGSDAPKDFTLNQGWVLIALQNAFYQLLHAGNLEEGIVDTIGRGGDTDTNGAIAGALLGAVWGVEALPRQWLDCILRCRPEEGRAGVEKPRPVEYWPVDLLELAGSLLAGGRGT